ncbi:MAG: DUF302 domain-containing protein [Ignavibacteriaceae bacterium]|nr:DUF302 domain-containing protein [Ignavibacteriaceae bacterium]NUM72164.1 DUF302 domain-containing protein [Ignavibacteriaceae bacterium]
MSYYFKGKSNENFDQTIENVTALLKEEGFGVLTEIDVQATLKKKIDVDFRKYRILGACNPPFAHKALSAEDNIGLMMPCNVVVQEYEDGEVWVSAINPEVAMKGTGNDNLAPFAKEISARLERVINRV